MSRRAAIPLLDLAEDDARQDSILIDGDLGLYAIASILGPRDGPTEEDVLGILAEHVFEPFFTTKDTGTGLGLAMAVRIIEAHGGAVHVVRGRGLGDGGRGARFEIHLPVEGPERATEAA